MMVMKRLFLVLALLCAALIIAGTAAKPGILAAQGPSAAARERQDWAVRVTNHIGRFTKHPDVVRRLSCEAAREGRVVVQFSIDRAGNISGARLMQSAKIRDLDQAVLAAVKQASPVPAPPSSLPGASLKLQLPVEFASKCVPNTAGG